MESSDREVASEYPGPQPLKDGWEARYSSELRKSWKDTDKRFAAAAETEARIELIDTLQC